MRIKSILVCLFSLSACVNLPSTVGQFEGSYTEIAFPSVLPAQGEYNIRGVVSNITVCPEGVQCLVSDHAVIIAEEKDQLLVKLGPLMIYSQQVKNLRVGETYLFSFEKANLLGAKLL